MFLYTIVFYRAFYIIIFVDYTYFSTITFAFSGKKRPGEESTEQPNKRVKLSYDDGEDPIYPASDISDELRQVYEENWSSIRSSRTVGVTQDRLNVRLRSLHTLHLHEPLWSFFETQEAVFKINLSYGFILRNTETGMFLCFFFCEYVM